MCAFFAARKKHDTLMGESPVPLAAGGGKGGGAWIDEVDIYIYTQLYIYIYHTPIYTNIIYIRLKDICLYIYVHYIYTIYKF